MFQAESRCCDNALKKTMAIKEILKTA